MSDKWDSMLQEYGLDERMFALRRFSREDRDNSRSALRAEIAKVERERDEANITLNKAMGIIDSLLHGDNLYSDAYCSEFIKDNRARLAKGSEA